MVVPSKNPAKEAQRKRIERDVAKFLDSGGRVEVIPTGKSALNPEHAKAFLSWDEINEENPR